MIEKRYTCTVCGYPSLYEQPWIFENRQPSDEICPCCGTHFGYFDFGTTKDEIILRQIELRKKWIESGMKWWTEENGRFDERKPKNWNPQEQLKNIPEEFK